MTEDAGKRKKQAALMKALETAKPDRKLVTEGFREHLRTFGPTWEKEIRFYRNLRAAYLSDASRIGAYTNILDSTWAVKKYGLPPPRWSSDRPKNDDLLESRVGLLGNINLLAWTALGVDHRDRGTAWDEAWRSIWVSHPTPLDPFIQIVQGGCFAFWVGRVAVHVVMATVHIQGDRIHREDGPAVQYEDGSGVWFWEGVLIPKQYVLHPEKITPQRILAEDNAETRRGMIERYGGWDRFMQDVHPEVLDTDGQNQLVRIPVEVDGQSPFIALKLRCSSTGRLYVLRVAPWAQKVKEALAWTFELRKARDYRLQAET